MSFDGPAELVAASDGGEHAVVHGLSLGALRAETHEEVVLADDADDDAVVVDHGNARDAVGDEGLERGEDGVVRAARGDVHSHHVRHNLLRHLELELLPRARLVARLCRVRQRAERDRGSRRPRVVETELGGERRRRRRPDARARERRRRRATRRRRESRRSRRRTCRGPTRGGASESETTPARQPPVDDREHMLREALGAVGRTLYAPTVPLTPVLDRSALDSKKWRQLAARRGSAHTARARRLEPPRTLALRLASKVPRASRRSILDPPRATPTRTFALGRRRTVNGTRIFPPRSAVAGTRSRSDTRTIAPRRGVSRELKRERRVERDGRCVSPSSCAGSPPALGIRPRMSPPRPRVRRPVPSGEPLTSPPPSPSLPQPLPSASRCCCTSGSCGTSSFGSSPSS